MNAVKPAARAVRAIAGMSAPRWFGFLSASRCQNIGGTPGVSARR
jgi:hypothetical protein